MTGRLENGDDADDLGDAYDGDEEKEDQGETHVSRKTAAPVSTPL